MTLAYSYVRFSSKTQATGASLQRQLEASELFCLKHGLTLSDVSFRDLGVSAFKEKIRASLEDMLTAIENGTIPKGSYILIEALDRLSRKGISHTQDILKSILRQGVSVAFVGEDARTLSGMVLTEASLDDLTSVIMVSLATDLAHKESLRKAKLVQDAKARTREKAKQGIPIARRLPFWLQYQDGTYIFNDKVSVIREIVSLRQQGQGPRRIATYLNLSEIDAPAGRGWSHTTVSHILTAPYLCGDYQTYRTIDDKLVPDTLVKDYFPAVVCRDEWLLLKADQKYSSKGKVAKDNPFAGVLKCKCGGGLVYSLKKMRGKSKESYYEYHHCSNSKLGLCDQKGYIRDLIPLLKRVMNKLEIKTIKNDRSSIIQASMDEANDKIRHLNRLLLELASPPLSVLQSILELEAKVETAKSELHQVMHANIGLSSSDVDRLASISDAAEYNMHIKRLVERIAVSHSSKQNYSVRIKKRDGHTQSFIVLNGEIKLMSDSEKLKNWLQEHGQSN